MKEERDGEERGIPAFLVLEYRRPLQKDQLSAVIHQINRDCSPCNSSCYYPAKNKKKNECTAELNKHEALQSYEQSIL